MIVNTCSRMVKQHSRIEQFYPEIICGVYYSNTGMNIKSDQSILNGYVLEYCGHLNFSCHTEFIEVRLLIAYYYYYYYYYYYPSINSG